MLVGSALLLLSTLFNRDVRRAALPLIVVTAFVGISGAASSVWWPEIAGRLTDHGDGEPLTLQGASFWPTILLRALGIILSISLIWQGLRRGNENLKIDVASYLKLPRPSNVNEEMQQF